MQDAGVAATCTDAQTMPRSCHSVDHEGDESDLHQSLLCLPCAVAKTLSFPMQPYSAAVTLLPEQLQWVIRYVYTSRIARLTSNSIGMQSGSHQLAVSPGAGIEGLQPRSEGADPPGGS